MKNFSTRLIATERTWGDLVLDDNTRSQIAALETWLHQPAQDGNGYRALFYGPPGAGKTFTANLLGKSTGKEVYKVDLSTVVSKYVGKTEKHLDALFEKAADKGWILFFDEADALFDKRTNVKDAHDRYANQEVAYLLQRMEEYKGLIILAASKKDNMDDAFLRRFNAIIPFPVPPKK